jgi:hypothetical protein
MSGNEPQKTEALGILRETRRKLYAILATDPASDADVDSDPEP